MKAMVFAAGLGTRLRPITDQMPKALVKVGGITLLERTLFRLRAVGVTSAIVNIHHHADQMESFIQGLSIPGMEVAISDEREALLDTGGGLSKAAWFLKDAGDFFVCNADILTNLDLTRLMTFHQASGGLATLAVKNRETSRYLLFDETRRLCGWENRVTAEKRVVLHETHSLLPLAFSGIQVINSLIFNHIKSSGKFSIISLYLDLAAAHSILAFEDNESLVLDLGKISEIEKAEEMIRNGLIV